MYKSRKRYEVKQPTCSHSTAIRSGYVAISLLWPEEGGEIPLKFLGSDADDMLHHVK